jgi:hypothetical protein
MIDPVLSQLTDDLKAAEATLNSPDFGAKQARLVALEQEARDTIARIDAERETLAASLEGDEAAYENAQNALTAYIAANYLESVERTDEDMFEQITDGMDVPASSGQWLRAGAPEPSMPEEDRKFYSGHQWDADEYASAKSNGALTD